MSAFSSSNCPVLTACCTPAFPWSVVRSQRTEPIREASLGLGQNFTGLRRKRRVIFLCSSFRQLKGGEIDQMR